MLFSNRAKSNLDLDELLRKLGYFNRVIYNPLGNKMFPPVQVAKILVEIVTINFDLVTV